MRLIALLALIAISGCTTGSYSDGIEIPTTAALLTASQTNDVKEAVRNYRDKPASFRFSRMSARKPENKDTLVVCGYAAKDTPFKALVYSNDDVKVIYVGTTEFWATTVKQVCRDYDMPL